MTETHDLQNEQRAPLREVSLKVAVDNASSVQGKLAEFGISSLVAGGVAVDLLAVKHLPDHKPRSHSDVELIVPIAERGRLVDVIDEVGFDDPSSIYSGDVHFASLAVKGVKYDIFLAMEMKSILMHHCVILGKEGMRLWR